MSLAIAHDDVLRLEIPMNEDPRQRLEALRYRRQNRQGGQFLAELFAYAEITAEAVLEEIMLLPKIEGCVELSRQFLANAIRRCCRQAMQLCDFLERGFIEAA